MAKREPKKEEKVEEKSIEEVEIIIPEEIGKIEEEIPIQEAPEQKILIAEGWVPRTKLGKDIAEGKITDIDYLFSNGIKITEPGIVDTLVKNLNNEIILIGGSAGKGGGIRRTPSKRTTRMHKSGRRYRISVMVIIGNGNGYVGLGLAKGIVGMHREVLKKSLNRAKLNLIPVMRGCGSWECNCGGNHSIPFNIRGKEGSVKVELISAPKGIGLCVSDEVKKMMRLAGIKDIWCKARGQTRSRINLLKACFNALRKLNTFKVKSEYEKAVGLKIGRVD